MFPARERSVFIVLFALTTTLWLAQEQAQAQCRSGQRQQNRSPQYAIMSTMTRPNYPQQQYAILIALRQQYVTLITLPQQYVTLIAWPQRQCAMQAALPRQQSAMNSVNRTSLASTMRTKPAPTEVLIITSGQSTAIGTGGNTETSISSEEDAAQGKLKLAEMLADDGRQQRFKGNETKAKRLLARARSRLQEIVDSYPGTEAARTAKTSLVALAE